MPFKRIMVQEAGLSRIMRAGDNWDNPSISTVTADANATITATQVSGGVTMFTGFTAGRTLTTDTAANILAAFPEMDIGDSYGFTISIIPAFAGTFAAGTGVTLAGRATCPAATAVTVYVTRTGAAAITWTVL
jgi:hypothetical protein